MPLSSPAFTCSNLFCHHESFIVSFVLFFISCLVFVNHSHFTEHFFLFSRTLLYSLSYFDPHSHSGIMKYVKDMDDASDSIL